MIEVKLSNGNILKRTVLKLRDDTVDKLQTLDKDKYNIDFIHYSYSITLFKMKKRKKRIGIGTRDVFVKIAIFHPYSSDIEAITEEDFEECKSLGKEIGYESITKHWDVIE